MTVDDNRLFGLLPRVYQRTDDDQGGPLKALLAVITEQADLLDADMDQLYEDWFIETCQDWVVPYLGDVIGYRGTAGMLAGLRADAPEAGNLLAAIASRRDVAHTVGNRRRKGTLALLEQLSLDIAGWPARAVEFRRLLGVTQAIRLHGRDVRADTRRLRRGRLVRLASRRCARPYRRAVRRAGSHGGRAPDQLRARTRPIQHPTCRAVRVAAAALLGHQGTGLL